MSLINFSEFDSKIFNCQVGKVFLTDKSDSDEVLQQLKSDSSKIIFAFTPFTQSHIHIVLENYGFHLASIRSTYLAKVEDLPNFTNSNIKIVSWSQEQPAIREVVLKKIAKTIGSTSRYYQDTSLPSEAVHELYLTWIKNSLYQNYADEVLLAYSGNRFAGWLSLKIGSDKASIDLIGVLSEFQHAGIGASLIAYARKLLYKKVNFLETITEGENIRAIRFYSKNGFKLTNLELAYHYHQNNK